jgi:peptidoglycan/xylan/chitin deacetylase (PgdA/CDA1 family)
MVDAFAVTPETFRRQLDALEERFDIVPLAEIAEARGTGRNGRRLLAALTLDDALRCQAEYAIPLLRERQLPFTICVPTDATSTGVPLWSLLLRYCLAATAPKVLNLGCMQMNLQVSADCRRVLADTVSSFVGALPGSARQPVLNQIFEQCQDVLQEALRHEAFQPMSWDELGHISGPGCDVASHSCSHGSLAHEDGVSLVRETRVSKQVIEARTGRPCGVFCFPYGDYHAESLAAARDAGYDWLLTTCGTTVDAFRGDVVPRIDARTLVC